MLNLVGILKVLDKIKGHKLVKEYGLLTDSLRKITFLNTIIKKNYFKCFKIYKN